MTERQEILAALRTALDSLAQGGGSWLSNGVEHTTDYSRFTAWDSRGAIVYAWLGSERATPYDGVMGNDMTLQLVCWARIKTDRATIDDDNEMMIADLKRAILMLDEVTYPQYGGQSRIIDARPNVVAENEGDVMVVGEIIYSQDIS